MLTTTGIDVGTEHLRCPDTVEKHADAEYVRRAYEAQCASEDHVWQACDAAATAADYWWIVALRGIAVVLWFLRPFVRRLCARHCWAWDRCMIHRVFGSCTWSTSVVVAEQRRARAHREAAVVLALRGYEVYFQAFNLPPGAVPIVG